MRNERVHIWSTCATFKGINIMKKVQSIDRKGIFWCWFFVQVFKVCFFYCIRSIYCLFLYTYWSLHWSKPLTCWVKWIRKLLLLKTFVSYIRHSKDLFLTILHDLIREKETERKLTESTNTSWYKKDFYNLNVQLLHIRWILAQGTSVVLLCIGRIVLAHVKYQSNHSTRNLQFSYEMLSAICYQIYSLFVLMK